jgi:hypothetical protein
MANKVCVSVTCIRVRAGKHLCDVFALKNVLKKRDVSWPFFFNVAVQYAIRRVRVNKDGLKLNGTF